MQNTSTTTKAGARAQHTPELKRSRSYTHEQLIAKATEIVPTATSTLFKIGHKWIASRQSIRWERSI